VAIRADITLRGTTYNQLYIQILTAQYLRRGDTKRLLIKAVVIDDSGPSPEKVRFFQETAPFTDEAAPTGLVSWAYDQLKLLPYVANATDEV